jgi:putative transcriptional regulator
LTVPAVAAYSVRVSRYESTVREHRERLGLSQEALARTLGVSRQTISNIEKGMSEPRVLLAIAIGLALGVEIADLFRKGMFR